MRSKKILSIVLSFAILLSFVTPVCAAFSDVPENHPYKDAIEFSRANGFISGTSSTTFSPDTKVTRAQFASIWCKTLNIKTDNHAYTDVTRLRNSYDSSAIILRGLGILSGTSTASFSPYGNLTREQLAIVTMRTYNLGVADENDYKQYTDYALISNYAISGVNSCINADVFEGLYDGETLKPKDLVTRGELCKLIYNISVPKYTVTVANLEGGTIIASPTNARPGTVISLTIVPDAGKQLKSGTLKYNGVEITGSSFIMPAENVTITAQFEDIPVVLESISVTTPPTKATYTVGETLDLTGMVVTASYSNNTTNIVTGYTTTPAEGSTLSVEGTITIDVSYTEANLTKTTSFTIQVNPAG